MWVTVNKPKTEDHSTKCFTDRLSNMREIIVVSFECFYVHDWKPIDELHSDDSVTAELKYIPRNIHVFIFLEKFSGFLAITNFFAKIQLSR